MKQIHTLSLALLSSCLLGQDAGSAGMASRLATPEQQDRTAADATVRRNLPAKEEDLEQARQFEAEQARHHAETLAAKARERAPRRFAEDLFQTRQTGLIPTEGGISDDYVLGIGDQVQINGFGSANFDVPAQVDGRGEVVVPRMGSIRVAGLSLARARAAVQAKVAQQVSRTTVELSILKLREVRVFVMGEVYRPGGYVVPSLSSLVNVLSLAGGPTENGSFREIRVMRGGKPVFQIDLYPLRCDGLGNLNFSLQSGDTIFVPLAFNQVTLEGAFTRVVAPVLEEAADEEEGSPSNRTANLQLHPGEGARQTRRGEAVPSRAGDASSAMDAGARPGRGRDALLAPAGEDTLAAEKARAPRSVEERSARDGDEQDAPMSPEDRLKARRQAKENAAGMPTWLARWQAEGGVPSMQFELLPGETVKDALHFAGGLAIQASEENLNLRRRGPGGVLEVLDLPLAGAGKVELRRGDTLSALASRERLERIVTVVGWVRVPGGFARTEGLRVGDLLKREGQILPDTYLRRGEIVRTLPDQSTRYLAFDVAQALAGQEAHNLLLEDRDRVELHRTSDLRLKETVRVLGPLTHPGSFPFHEGMRASDLLFQGGIPLHETDRFVAELAHSGEGVGSEVIRLDLKQLLSSERSSPVALADEAVNPLLKPMDQISVYAKPDYHEHRTITLEGQVMRPGVYALDKPNVSLKEIIVRAGGLTPEAMPQSAIFLRALVPPSSEEARIPEGPLVNAKNPYLSGIDAILDRLSETKRQPTTGNLLKSPVLHGVTSGNLSRLVVNIPAILGGSAKLDVNLQDGDRLIVPRLTEAVYVVGETASPFMTYKVTEDLKVRNLLKIAGGLTRNADEDNIRLLKADGRILDRGVMGLEVEPGDAVLVPQRIKRDTTWQENLQALTPLALMLNALRIP